MNATAPASAGPVFGDPVLLERLAIYPVTLANQVDIGPVTTLDEALRLGTAEVREVGAEGPEHGANPSRTSPDARARANGPAFDGNVQRAGNDIEQVQVADGGATVNTLVIENRGSVAIFVLAGTIVKGGKQDRQIGQDFIVGPARTVPVDAFCVEQGRWTTTRDGAVTGGRFSAAPGLVNSKVRAAGQYQKDQQAVWSEVAKTNKAHDKSADSGTLFATLGDATLTRETDALASRIDGVLSRVTPPADLVGFAWAIDGRLQGVRWFAHERLFALVRAQLIKTAAIDVLTAVASGPATAAIATPPASQIAAFVAEIEARGDVETRSTDGNDNEYRESARGFGSKTLLKGQAGKQRPIAFDYIAK